MQAKPFKQLSYDDKVEAVRHIKALHQADNNAQQYALSKGRACQEFVKGNTLTADEKAELEEADKIPVQSTEALTKIAAIIGMLAQTAKDGIIVGNAPEDAAPAELRQKILKDYIEKLSQIDRAESQVAQDTLITSIPGFLWLEPFDPRDPAEKGMHIRAMPWESVVPDAAWRDPSMRDMRRIHRHLQMSYEDVLARGFTGTHGLNEFQLRDLEKAASNVTAKSIGQSDYLSSRNGDNYTAAGLLNVVESLEWRYVETQVAFDQYGNSEVVPPLWTPEELQQFLQETPGWTVQVQKDRVLWATVWTSSSILLDYGPHWLQIKEFPCSPFVPANIDGQWAGMIEFVVDTIKAMSYAKTEHLQGIRSVNNGLWKIKEGAVKDIEEFETQRKTPGGTVVIAEDANLDDANPVANQRENQAFLDWFNMNSDALDRQTVERNFEGGAQASQESSKAIGARIAQTLNKLQFFLQGYNPMRMDIRRKATKALPYCFPDHIVLRLIDPKNGMQSVEVNKPAEYDMEGTPTRTVNNLGDGDFDYTFTEGDNSINGQEIERTVMNEFLKFSVNLPPEMAIAAALSYPSTAIQKYGAELKANQEAQKNAPPPPPPPPKMSISISSADIGTEAVTYILQDQGFLPKGQPNQQGPVEEGVEGEGSNPEEESVETNPEDPNMGQMPPEMGQPNESEM